MDFLLRKISGQQLWNLDCIRFSFFHLMECQTALMWITLLNASLFTRRGRAVRFSSRRLRLIFSLLLCWEVEQKNRPCYPFYAQHFHFQSKTRCKVFIRDVGVFISVCVTSAWHALTGCSAARRHAGGCSFTYQLTPNDETKDRFNYLDTKAGRKASLTKKNNKSFSKNKVFLLFSKLFILKNVCWKNIKA